VSRVGSVTATVERAGAAWPEYDYAPALLPAGPGPSGPSGMWRYRDLLPLGPGPIRYPLPVGGTPLLPAPALRAEVGLPRLWLKDETRQPTGSNKDRATALVIEDGLRRGVGTVTTASTGNAAVATAFGAAAAGLRAVIFVSTACRPEKLALMTRAGAQVCAVAGGYAAAVDLSRAAAAAFGWLDRNTGVVPATLEAKKTVAFEVWEQLGRALPDAVVAPVGDGPTLAALGKGFEELQRCGLTRRLPRLVGVQAESCSPLVAEWRGEPAAPEQLDPGGTVADGIAVPRPATGPAALDAVARSGGGMVAVPDDALRRAVATLAARAGVQAEPAGAASLAAVGPALDGGLLDPAETVVLLVTGRGVPPAGHRGASPDVPVVATLDDVERVLAAR
jgi:threonine synthase